MFKRWLMVVSSILVVVLIVLGSQANIIGYQTVQTSHQYHIKERINQKDLLFQTILDLINNIEIQKVFLESPKGKLFNPFIKMPLHTFPTLTKNQLNFMYYLGVFLLERNGKTRMDSSIKKYPSTSIQTENKINYIIQNNAKLNKEITQLSLGNCPCSESNFYFPIICSILAVLAFIFGVLSFIPLILFWAIFVLIATLGILLCNWGPYLL